MQKDRTGVVLLRTGGAAARTGGALERTWVALQRTCGGLERTGGAMEMSRHVLPLEPASAPTAWSLIVSYNELQRPMQCKIQYNCKLQWITSCN